MGDAMDPSLFPLGRPPNGTFSNFDNPASLESLGHTAMGVFMAITAAFLILRIYVKLTITKQWGWDDGESRAANKLMTVANSSTKSLASLRGFAFSPSYSEDQDANPIVTVVHRGS